MATEVNTTVGTGSTDAQATIDKAAGACLICGRTRVYVVEKAGYLWGRLDPRSDTNNSIRYATPAFLPITVVAIAPATMPSVVRLWPSGVKRLISASIIDFVIAPGDLEWELGQG